LILCCNAFGLESFSRVNSQLFWLDSKMALFIDFSIKFDSNVKFQKFLLLRGLGKTILLLSEPLF
jgi:hypothetical protein